jgi:methylenetetrahydrofolate reductase (NADPH)
MKITEHFKDRHKTLFSFELLPPLKGDNIQKIYDTIDPLMEFNPPYINVTYHREEVVYKDRGSGLLEKKIVRKRPGTVAISAAIMYKYKVDVVPHIICGGFTKEETENALIDFHFLGFENLLAVRGDTMKNEKTFTPEPGGNAHALDLVKQIVNLNRGKYLDEEIENKTTTNFSVGIAGYPEKHVEAPNLRSDLHFLKQKVDAGAEFIVTQMFFDNRKYFEFVKRCRDAGITVPIIPGLKPVSTSNHINYLPQTFNIDLPEELVKEILKCNGNQQMVRQAGIEWSVCQTKDLIAAGVPVVHFYTMGRSDNIRKIAEAAF